MPAHPTAARPLRTELERADEPQWVGNNFPALQGIVYSEMQAP